MRKLSNSRSVKPRPCPKCGSEDIYTRFHPASDCSFDTCSDCHEIVGVRENCHGGQEEHLRMVCRGCGFTRYNSPLDAMGVTA